MIAIKAQYIIVSSEEIYNDHSLIFDNDVIIDIIPNNELNKKYNDIKVINKENHILMPGFINAHMHQYGMLSRGIPVNVEFKNFEEFLKDYWWPYIEDRIRLRHLIATTKASAIELLESGVTTYCDTLEAPFIEENSLIKQAEIVEEIGMKAVLSLESCERVSYENGIKCLEENENLIKWSKKNSSLVKGMICTHTSFTCSPKFLKEAKKRADNLDEMWQFHLSESIYEPNKCKEMYKSKPVMHYDNHGLLSSNVLASQCVQVELSEMDILKEKGVKIVHMPLSNCEVGGGIAKIPKMLEKGIKVALGTDGYINDFFTLMKSAFLIHKGNEQDATVMPAKEVFKMATEYGAYALNMENSGTLNKGNTPDFIILENQFKTLITDDNIFDQIVTFGEKEYIDSVYINGKAVIENKKLLTLDKDEVRKEMLEASEDFWSELQKV